MKFRDEFEGPNGDPDAGSYPSNCYTMNPVCSVRLDWFAEGPCFGNSFSQFSNLNKCKWTVWGGYSFWDDTGVTSYLPSQISVSKDSSDGNVGTLNIKIASRTGSGIECGPKGAPDTMNNDRWKINCPLVSGGVDSKYRNPTTKGWNFKKGRVEIRAKIAAKPSSGDFYSNSWPALWTWTGDEQNGYPYSNANPSNPKYTNELDILEVVPKPGQSKASAYQTYHTWFTNGRHYASGSRSDIKVAPGKYETYGLERYPNYILYSVGTCYTRKVADGDMEGKDVESWQQHGGTVSVNSEIPVHFILGMGFDKEFMNSPYSELDGAEFKIDYLRQYE